jgi:hypothetical protein
LCTITVRYRAVSPHFVEDVPQLLAVVTDYPDSGVTMLRSEPAERIDD